YNHCKKFNGTSELSLSLQAQHRKRQFIRVSQFTAADIRQVVEKARGVVDLGSIYPELSQISSAGMISDTAAQAFTAKVARIEQRTRDMYPHAAWELPVIYVAADELSTAEFSCLWRQGIVVVVRGLLSALNGAIWQPEWWIKHFGDEKVSILDCARKAEPVGGGEWPLRNFYRLFDGSDKYAALFDTPDDDSSSEHQLHSEKEGDNNDDRGRAADRAAREWREHKACVARGILKLKDWPPTDDFERRLPRHFRHFMKALPFPEYTQRAGKFNLANRLPAAFVPPDLGPKMYCAYGSSDGEGGVGTTNLHCDMADAVNIMAYAPAEFLRERNIEVPGIWTRSDGSPHMSAASKSTTAAPAAAAVWDIYPPEALGNLREFIGQVHDIPFGAECKGPVAAKYGDPIHNQETYLSLPLRQKFFDEYGHKCYRIYQIPGDAVFVPAGCAHQVCNYASAVKVAMDFVSPERVEYSRRLTEDFRQLDGKHPRSRDLLQLGNILWWTFAGKQKPAQPNQPVQQPAAPMPKAKRMNRQRENEKRREKRLEKVQQQQQQPLPLRRPAGRPKMTPAGRPATKKTAEPGSTAGAKDSGESIGTATHSSLSSLSSLSSSFSIEEAGADNDNDNENSDIIIDDVDEGDDNDNDYMSLSLSTLLEESKRLNTHLTSSEIPSVQRGLDLLESESRKLVARSVRNGGALDPRAQSMLASSGVDTDELTDNVAPASLLSAFELLQSDYDANVESYLGQMQEQSIVEAIEGSGLSTLDDFDRYMSLHMRNVWEDTQRRLFEELGQYQGAEQQRPFVDSLSGEAASLSSFAQPGGLAFGLAEGGGIKCTQPRVERYAQVVRKLNDARVSSSSSSSSSSVKFELLAGLEKATADSSQELKSKQIGQVWRLLAHYTAPSSASGAVLSGDADSDSDRRLVAGACEYLEQTFIEHVDLKISQYPHDANVGGVPSVHRRMQGYLKIQFGRLGRVPAFLEVFDNEPIWAHMFLLYRCGYKQELLAYALDMEDIITDSDPGFVTHLKAFLDGSPSLRSSDVPVTASSLEDPYKAALYKVVGRGNVPKKAVAEVIQTTEDYLWSSLAQIRDADKIYGGSSAAGGHQSRSTLEGLQQMMLKFGPAHFDPSGNSPLLYFRVLLLCGLFESAIDYLLRVEKFQVEAVHMAIALAYYKLLRLPPPLAAPLLAGSEPAVAAGGSFSSYLVAS
ncbi:nuclear pore complex subunit, partial [Coemansia sp. RSA 1836]